MVARLFLQSQKAAKKAAFGVANDVELAQTKGRTSPRLVLFRIPSSPCSLCVCAVARQAFPDHTIRLADAASTTGVIAAATVHLT